MATANNFIIYIEDTIIGSKLSLTIKKKKKYTRWSVENRFNGLTRGVEVSEDIHGFYKVGDVVDLHVYDTSNKESIIKNVTIQEKKEVTLNV